MIIYVIIPIKPQVTERISIGFGKWVADMGSFRFRYFNFTNFPKSETAAFGRKRLGSYNGISKKYCRPCRPEWLGRVLFRSQYIYTYIKQWPTASSTLQSPLLYSPPPSYPPTLYPDTAVRQRRVWKLNHKVEPSILTSHHLSSRPYHTLPNIRSQANTNIKDKR